MCHPHCADRGPKQERNFPRIPKLSNVGPSFESWRQHSLLTTVPPCLLPDLSL